MKENQKKEISDWLPWKGFPGGWLKVHHLKRAGKRIRTRGAEWAPQPFTAKRTRSKKKKRGNFPRCKRGKRWDRGYGGKSSKKKNQLSQTRKCKCSNSSLLLLEPSRSPKGEKGRRTKLQFRKRIGKLSPSTKEGTEFSDEQNHEWAMRERRTRRMDVYCGRPKGG